MMVVLKLSQSYDIFTYLDLLFFYTYDLTKEEI